MESILNLFKAQHEFWLNFRPSISKTDLLSLSFKDSLTRRLKGFLTPEYYKRKNLIEEGDLVFSYLFKSCKNTDNQYNFVPFWALFSPSSAVNENPQILRSCALLLTNRSIDANDKRFKKLLKLLEEPYSDASYYELPVEVTGGYLIYLSIVYLPRYIADNIILGFNPFLANRSISNEILFLQDAYWEKSFRDAYYSRKLI